MARDMARPPSAWGISCPAKPTGSQAALPPLQAPKSEQKTPAPAEDTSLGPGGAVEMFPYLPWTHPPPSSCCCGQPRCALRSCESTSQKEEKKKKTGERKEKKKKKEEEEGWDFKGKSLRIQQITAQLLGKDSAPFGAAHQPPSGKAAAPQQKLSLPLPAVAGYAFHSPWSLERVEFCLLRLASGV